ncbi:hypothetical protein D3OALGA1CA_1873 [Olavius algarvensis associated proteobacterium Delta 3]|nr:hypothetical protein D3OALGA1CA_1873 [Olavius algarvensis associated proteobacterium Delta 3]CAB5135287.1 hypothetical protein D3OALGB2SA_3890 [Olavius algarvensis associated proteobacterium Delta 3]
MGSKDSAFDEFIRLCRSWSEQMAALKEEALRIDYMRGQLPELLLNRPVVGAILNHIAKGDPVLNMGRCGIFENEILIYLDPQRLFSVRVYFHLPGEFTPIHDHSAWGFNGTPQGALDIVRYRREDDGADPRRASLKKTEQVVLTPGEVGIVHRLDAGIHRTGNTTDRINAMISVYGSPIRRLYIRTFDPGSGRIEKRFPPKIQKRQLAKIAMRQYNEKI